MMVFTECSLINPNKELYKETDKLVESLYTTYDHYSIIIDNDFVVTTQDNLYVISPMGRLINVKINKAVDNNEYKKLQTDLEKHYKNNSKVNSVYICNGGTIMIDCRN